VVVLCLTIASIAPGNAEDWPTYQHDNQRSGITPEALKLPLNEVWRYAAPNAPRPAWPDPAKYDFAQSNDNPLRPREVYDRAFHTVVAEGVLYFGSSADDKVYALDAATGEERWRFFTDGPVRLAPSVYEGKVYFGSDDGCAYCLRASDGALVWKREPAKTGRGIPGNGRVISVHPVRTGVLVSDGVAYFCAGLFPEEDVYIYAVDAHTGKEVWKTVPDPQAFMKEFTRGKRTARQFALSPQGYLLASESRLYLPTGRTSPAIVDRNTGEVLGLFNCGVGDGGTYALLANGTLTSWPGVQLTAFNADTQEKVAAFPGRCLVVTDAVSYLLSDRAVSALDRAVFDKVNADRRALGDKAGRLQRHLKDVRRGKESLADGETEESVRKEIDAARQAIKDSAGREYVWTTPCGECFTVILASDTLFTGGDGSVTAYGTSDGQQVWTATVKGKVYGLAVAQGRLYASTDQGEIHCFASETVTHTKEITATATTKPLPSDGLTDAYASAAQHVLETSPCVPRGYCLDLGCGDGRLAYELARRTNDLRIVAVDDDEKRVAAARATLDRTGLYGSRITVHQFSLKSVPFTEYMANLIVFGQSVADGKLAVPAAEVLRLLRPCGGMAILGQPGTAALSRDDLERWTRTAPDAGWDVAEKDGVWAVLRRVALPGAGEWTHAYADPDNTACSSDRLVRGPMRLQWFGLPGPRPMVDRHHRAMPPLVQNGRLFVPADSRVIAADAYNGTPLWEVEIPESRRLAAPRDAGQLAVNGEYLYAATRGECWVLDVETGKRAATFTMPQLTDGEEHYWGYVATVDDLLFGSGRKEKAAYTRMDTFGDYEIQWGDFERMIVSEYLFAMDRKTGKTLWTYKNGLIIHPTLAIGNGRSYFVESRSSAAKDDPYGRVTLEVLWQSGPRLVALDMRTGATAWEKPVDLALCQHIIYLSFADGVLLVTGSSNREDKAWYYLYAFDANTGAPLWQADHPNNKGGIGGDHGEQIHHPVIVNGVVFAEPVAYNLHTGARITPTGEAGQWMLTPREGCGTLSGSEVSLFYRDGHPCFENLAADARRTRLNYISRPGCWINMIPAGGLLLIPEASSGCSCPYPLQASFAYIPCELPTQ
jgi:outer membrane protein assembly factor BamB